MSFKSSKKSLAAYKGHLNLAVKSFNLLLDVKPDPTMEAVAKIYVKVQERSDALFKCLDGIIMQLNDTSAMEQETVDVDTESKAIMEYYDELITKQSEIESQYVTYREKCAPKEPTPTARPVVQLPYKPTVRLIALEPPSWNGVKADFYTWKRKFTHIMEEAKVSDELTQLCYLQSPKILPKEYQNFVADCASITDVWSRLEERVPKETIKYEVIGQFRRVKGLPNKRSPEILRGFANEISLFCIRMSDLDLHKDNYSCIIMQDVYERLDHDTALRYRSKIELKKELGLDVEEDLDSLSSFLRSEATTLELSVGNTFASGFSNSTLSKKFNMINVTDNIDVKPDSEVLANSKLKCFFGCNEMHRLIDCTVYMGLSAEKKREFIKNSSRCYVCLGAYHKSRNCPKRREDAKCRICGGNNHHWSICFKTEDQISTLQALAPPFHLNVNENSLSFYSTKTPGMLDIVGKTEIKPKDYSPVVIAEVKNVDGNWIKAKCFLDTGSNSSLVRQKFARDNDVHGNGPCRVKFGIAGGGIHYEHGEEFELEIRPLGGSESYYIMATGIKKPCFDAHPITSEIFSKYKHLQKTKESIFIDGGEIDILIGSDYAPLILPESVLRATTCPDDSPSVAFTRLGCYLYGGLNKKSPKQAKQILNINFINKFEEDELRNFFYGDILGVKPTTLCVCSDNEISESAFIRHVRKTTRIDKDGRVCVEMPWKPGFPAKLPNNFKKAKEQLVRRENQLVKDDDLEDYNTEIEKLVQRGVVRLLTAEEAARAEYEDGWFLNRRMIKRLDKCTSKLRIVWDSAAVFKGVSLNGAFEKGPVYINSLFRCLLRWRKDQVAVTGDIEKMFNQISMSENDQRYHRFLWRNGDVSSPVVIFQLLRVLFGDKPSPDLAGYALRYLAETFREEYPVGASILEDETYVDDVSLSVGNPMEANRYIAEVDAILKCEHFSVKIWNSNSLDVDQNRDEEIVDVLGLCWNKERDTISMKPKEFIVLEEEFTKRMIMSTVAKLWAPFGDLLPVSIKYRIDLQRIWQNGFGWDQPLHADMVDVCVNNIHQMQLLADVNISRCLKPAGVIGKPQLHAFSDGGNEAFGTCVFIRWPTVHGIDVKFVAAKSFVAPLKHKTTPRLELMGAVAMSRLVEEVTKSLSYEFEYKRFWIDSEVVLYWVLSSSSRYKPFVSVRIQEIQDTHTNWKEEVKYIPSAKNPADCLTKPVSIDKLISWQEGKFCEFLKVEEEMWPETFDVESFNAESVKPVLEEKSLKKVIRKGKRNKIRHKTEVTDNQSKYNLVINSVSKSRNEVESNEFGYEMAERFSSWSKLLSAVAFMKRSFNSVSLNKSLVNPPNDIVAAEKTLFYICQTILRIDLADTKKRFLKFHPVYDTEGFIRAKGRLEKIDIADEVKHPILLPAEHPIVHLFATYHHRKYLHQGYRVIMANLINAGFLIGGGRQLLKYIASKCIFCRTRRRTLLKQMMGNLPPFRIQVKKSPFTSVAVDFFAYLKVKQSRNISVNASVMIITCTTTRCIHIELCITIDTNSFMRAWRRFTAIRGVHPSHVFSDGGTTFKGAHKPLLEWIESWDRYLIQKEFPQTSFDFQWEFNVPTASHMNGVVESLVNSVRKGLDAAVVNYTRSILTYEEWATVLSEVTYLINSRPLCPDGDPWEFRCITGNDILYPHGQPQVPQFEGEEVFNPRDMFKLVQCRVDVFWNTWLKHIPPQLISRNKWFHARDNLEKGDFVLVFEKGMKGGAAPRSLWKKAIVTKVHPGTDGHVRSVTIRDSSRNEYIRPIHKLCLIATRAELENGG